jgi:hypothetical protein
MAFFGSEDHPGDPRTRQSIERAFRRRQIETIALAAFVSAAVTTAIGLGVLRFRAPARSMSIPPPTVGPQEGCGGNCTVTPPRFDASLVHETPSTDPPTSVDPTKVIRRSNDTLAQIHLVTTAFADAAKMSETEKNADPRDAMAVTAVNEPGSADQAAATTMPIMSEPFRSLPALTPTSTDETRRFIERGRGFIGQGDITTARLFFERAADRGDNLAAFALAETYDPTVLARWNARTVSADPDQARTLYERALAGGLIAAKERLDRLGAE